MAFFVLLLVISVKQGGFGIKYTHGEGGGMGKGADRGLERGDGSVWGVCAAEVAVTAHACRRVSDNGGPGVGYYITLGGAGHYPWQPGGHAPTLSVYNKGVYHRAAPVHPSRRTPVGEAQTTITHALYHFITRI